MQESSIFWLRVAVVLYGLGLIHALVTVLRREATIFPSVRNYPYFNELRRA